MPLNGFGPVQFSVEGTFTDKPRLLMDGEEVPFDSLSIYHDPGFKFTNEAGKEEVIPPSTHLSFSVSAKIGQLEANVHYRVKANEEGKLVLAKMDEKEEKKGKKPPFKKKDEKKDDKSKDEKKGEKPDFKKFKKGKSNTITIEPAPNSPLGRDMWRQDLAERIADAGE